MWSVSWLRKSWNDVKDCRRVQSVPCHTCTLSRTMSHMYHVTMESNQMLLLYHTTGYHWVPLGTTGYLYWQHSSTPILRAPPLSLWFPRPSYPFSPPPYLYPNAIVYWSLSFPKLSLWSYRNFTVIRPLWVSTDLLVRGHKTNKYILPVIILLKPFVISFWIEELLLEL